MVNFSKVQRNKEDEFFFYGLGVDGAIVNKEFIVGSKV